VDLVLANAEGPYIKDVAAEVNVVDLQSRSVIFSMPALIRYLRRQRPEAMLSAMNHANVVAVWARQLAAVKTRLVVSQRHTLTASMDNVRFQRERLVSWLMRYSYNRADGVIAISCGVADDLAAAIGMPRNDIHVIYNPALLPNVIEKSRLPLLHPWFASDEPPVILAVGRLTAAKDFPTLIRAFARLRTERPVRMAILGEGERRGELEALVTKLGLTSDVILPGFVDNPFAWMRRSALFVLSSAWEGFGNVLVEAMACGIPIVSTDCPNGPAEILENGRWGRLVPVGDAKALAAAMAATLDESKHPNVEARAAMFDVDTAVEGYLRVLGVKT